jgi:hypothetical protein
VTYDRESMGVVATGGGCARKGPEVEVSSRCLGADSGGLASQAGDQLGRHVAGHAVKASHGVVVTEDKLKSFRQ